MVPVEALEPMPMTNLRTIRHASGMSKTKHDRKFRCKVHIYFDSAWPAPHPLLEILSDTKLGRKETVSLPFESAYASGVSLHPPPQPKERKWLIAWMGKSGVGRRLLFVPSRDQGLALATLNYNFRHRVLIDLDFGDLSRKVRA